MKKIFFTCITCILLTIVGCAVANPSYAPGTWEGSVFASRNGVYMMTIRITHDDIWDRWEIFNMFSGIDEPLGSHTGLDNRVFRPQGIK